MEWVTGAMPEMRSALMDVFVYRKPLSHSFGKQFGEKSERKREEKGNGRKQVENERQDHLRMSFESFESFSL